MSPVRIPESTQELATCKPTCSNERLDTPLIKDWDSATRADCLLLRLRLFTDWLLLDCLIERMKGNPSATEDQLVPLSS